MTQSGLWVWSIQHFLSYLYCVLFLIKWLDIVPNDPTALSEMEREILDIVIDTLALDPQFQMDHGQQGLSAQVAIIWSKLFSAHCMGGSNLGSVELVPLSSSFT